MGKFETDDWNEIVARNDNIRLSRALPQDILACFSDRAANDLSELYDEKDNRLKKRGAAVLAERANQMLNADNFVASFIIHNIGNAVLFQRVREYICVQDKPIIEKLPNVPIVNTSFGSIREFIKSPKPNGCN